MKMAKKYIILYKCAGHQKIKFLIIILLLFPNTQMLVILFLFHRFGKKSPESQIIKKFCSYGWRLFSQFDLSQIFFPLQNFEVLTDKEGIW